MKDICIILGCITLLAGCSKAVGNVTDSSTVAAPPTESALGKLHAKPAPDLLAQIKSQVQQPVLTVQSGTGTPLALTQLPQVSQAPFAPPADQVITSSAISVSYNKPDSITSIWPFNTTPKSPSAAADQAPHIATYGGYGGNSAPPPPPGANSSLVPPPPAVVLSTQAQPVGYGAPVDVYGNPYYPPPTGYSYPARSPGSLFGSGARSSSPDVGSATPSRHIDFVPIVPTGMDPRSAYKQRDDLKLLWKGAVSSSPLQTLIERDQRIAAGINAITLALPADSSRGTLNISQRQVDAIFKSPSVDRRVLPETRKLQLDLIQSYYRYLYAYNKYALAQQTVAARKQELDFANGAAEQQRSTSDWSAAKVDADAATDDMKSAQYELASVAGPQSARLIIGRVSGIAPNAESLAQASSGSDDSSQIQGRRHHLLGSLLHVSDKVIGPADVTSTTSKAQVTTSSPSKSKDGKFRSRVSASRAVAKDLSPAPDSAAQAAAPSSAPPSNNISDASGTSGSMSGSGITFQLRGVNVTPRKSILRVSVKNNGSDSFSFDPDIVSVCEGANKLSEAMVRADFDTTKVAPNQEVVGTITIFGRPWNDRLSISLADGARNIQLHR